MNGPRKSEAKPVTRMAHEAALATFRKRGERWQVQVRRKGFSPRSRTFASRRDAERWATLKEREFDLLESRGETQAVPSDISIADLLSRYRTQVVPQKRSAYSETYLVAAIERRAIGRLSLRRLSVDEIVRYRDARLKEIGPAGVSKELRLLQHAIEVARTSWGFHGLPNPVKDVKKPAEPRGRERRLAEGEEAALLSEVDSCRNQYVGAVTWSRPVALRSCLPRSARKPRRGKRFGWPFRGLTPNCVRRSGPPVTIAMAILGTVFELFTR